jgi:8-oxo-dGTP pyrophosphatase MutT (NUDIX family)
LVLLGVPPEKQKAVLRPISPANMSTATRVRDLADPVALDVVVTRRASTLRHHPNQVSFPGGSLEPGETSWQAALREAHEEIGLDPAKVTPVGRLAHRHIPVSGFTVAVEIGCWTPDDSLTPGDPAEVSSVHRIHIPDLTNPANRFSWVLPDTYFTGPGFDVDGLFIWGFTADILNDLLQAAGWEHPWNQATQRIVDPMFAGERSPEFPSRQSG